MSQLPQRQTSQLERLRKRLAAMVNPVDLWFKRSLIGATLISVSMLFGCSTMGGSTLNLNPPQNSMRKAKPLPQLDCENCPQATPKLPSNTTN